MIFLFFISNGVKIKTYYFINADEPFLFSLFYIVKLFNKMFQSLCNNPKKEQKYIYNIN